MKKTKPVSEIKRNDRADRGDDRDVRRMLKIPTVKLDIETQISEECFGGGDSLLEEQNKLPAAGAGAATVALQHGNKDASSECKQTKKEPRTYPKREEKIIPFSIGRRRELAQKYTFKRYEEQKETKKEEPPPKRDEIHPIVPTSVTAAPVERLAKCPEKRPIIKTVMQKGDSITAAPVEHLAKCPEMRPIIKTVMQKGDSITVYKAVSFEKKKTVPLRLSVPGKLNLPSSPISSRNSRNTSSAKSSMSNKSTGLKKNLKTEQNISSAFPMLSSPLKTTVSPTDSPKLTARCKLKNRSRRKRTSSPEPAPSLIPLTEIAKWKPETVTAHTKPYYEAWVNTTLSAISRNSDPKTLMEKRQIIKQFQRALENAPPVLTEEDMCDERNDLIQIKNLH